MNSRDVPKRYSGVAHSNVRASLAEFERDTAYSMRDSIAIIYRDWGDLDEALEYVRKSIEIKEKLGPVQALPYAYHQLAVILGDLGDSAGTEANFRRAIELARGQSDFSAVAGAGF